MDFSKDTEILLRDAGYETWPWDGGPVPVVCFEGDTILGFVYLFDSAEMIHEQWESAQGAALARFKPALRSAGEKAWNVYSLFLTESPADHNMEILLDRIEEDFRLTRKLVRAGVRSKGALRDAFLPILPIRNRPTIDKSNIEDRLEDALTKIHPSGAKAFLKRATAADIAQILAED